MSSKKLFQASPDNVPCDALVGQRDTSDGSRWMTDAGGDKLIYNLYTDPDRTTVWGTWYDKTTKGASIDVPLGRSQKTTGSLPIYGRIAANQRNVPPGAYKATINGGNAAVSYGYASKGSCESFKHGSRVSVGVSIAATVRGGQSGPGAITAPDATKPQASSSPQATTGEAEGKKSVFRKLGKGFALDIPSGYGSQESEARIAFV